MYKTILVPLDGSKRAEAILPHVEELARRYAARVIFLQAVEHVSVAVTGHALLIERSLVEFRRQVDEAASYLGSWQERFREKGINAWVCIEHGPAVKTIIYVAERESADLIAMASHGCSGLSGVFYGSVAAGVLSRVSRPLLLIRSQGERAGRESEPIVC